MLWPYKANMPESWQAGGIEPNSKKYGGKMRELCYGLSEKIISISR